MSPEKTATQRFFRLEEILHFIGRSEDRPSDHEIFSHLTGGRMRAPMGAAGTWKAYPGVSLSVHALLCELIYEQHPEVRAFPTPSDALDWLIDTEDGRRLGSPDDNLLLRGIEKESMSKHLVVVAADVNGSPIKAWRVNSKNSTEHRIDAWTRGRHLSYLYYLEVWSISRKNGAYALSVRPSGPTSYIEPGCKHTPPFSTFQPIITPVMLTS